MHTPTKKTITKGKLALRLMGRPRSLSLERSANGQWFLEVSPTTGMVTKAHWRTEDRPHHLRLSMWIALEIRTTERRGQIVSTLQF